MNLYFYWENEAIPFVEGETVGYSLFRNLKHNASLGKSPINQSYKLFCGIGACQGCLVYVEDRGITESCMVKASMNLNVRAITDEDRISLFDSGNYHE